ncbi:hypothetical protein ABK040_000390 [Willaertia magna]
MKEKNRRSLSMNKLSFDILFEVISFLTPVEILNSIELVCKYWREKLSLNNTPYWCDMCSTYFETTASLSILFENKNQQYSVDWKYIFKLFFKNSFRRNADTLRFSNLILKKGNGIFTFYVNGAVHPNENRTFYFKINELAKDSIVIGASDEYNTNTYLGWKGSAVGLCSSGFIWNSSQFFMEKSIDLNSKQMAVLNRFKKGDIIKFTVKKRKGNENYRELEWIVNNRCCTKQNIITFDNQKLYIGVSIYYDNDCVEIIQ